MLKKVCSFTGHRLQNLPFGENDARCVALKARLRETIEEQIRERGVTHFISGMARGVDTFAAEILVEFRHTYPEITWEAAIPCEEQAVRWNEADRTRYFSLIEQCDKETIVSRRYTPDCMQKRNRYMVDHSDIVIAVWDGGRSGTGQTVMYARSQGKTVLVLPPLPDDSRANGSA